MTDRTCSLELLRFVPSKVEGLADVGAVTIFPDRLEVHAGGHVRQYAFATIAKPQESAVRSKLKSLFGLRPWPPLAADRGWFHEPPDRFFVFYTEPPLKVCMPADELEDYGDSYFLRVQTVIRSGGYDTLDLG